MVPACRRASAIHPGRSTVATTASAIAPPANRAMTAAVGVQPASISALANGPESPKVSAEVSAKASPRETRESRVSGFASNTAHLTM